METYDVVIVGSGFGGSIPALRLAEDGRKVLVLEQGPRFTAKDYKMDWSFRNQMRMFVSFTSEDYTVFMRYGKGLGGGSVTYAAAMLRSPSEVFDYTDQNGYKVWPSSVTRSVLDPYYEKVEQMMEIERIAWEDVPKVGGCFAMLLDRMGLTCDRAMYPIHDCLHCGFCMCGCPYDRKKHLGLNYIPQAEELGAEFVVNAKVDHVEEDGDGSNHVVVYVDEFNIERKVATPMLIMAAGALETPVILQRSKNYLSDLHPQVGKNFNQNGDMALVFQLPEDFPDAWSYMGRNNAGMITYAFWEEHKITIHAGGSPPAIYAALDIVREDGGKPDIPFGVEFKHFLRDNYPNRLISSLAIGLVDGEGEVWADDNGLLKFNIPQTDHFKAYLDKVAGVGLRIQEETGAKLFRTADHTYEHGDAHPLATCRIGDNEEKAPCTPNGELRSNPGIYCADGASVPGGTGVNPAHTIAANAERIAAFLVENK